MSQDDKQNNQASGAVRFREIMTVMDDQSWIWQWASATMTHIKLPHVRVPSNTPIRHSWDRFRHAPRVVVHWESPARPGGAVIEEILDIQPSFDAGERIIVLTSNPTHEDVVYFAELGLRRIIRVRNRDKDLAKATIELKAHLTASGEKDAKEQAWRRLLYIFDTLPQAVPTDTIARLEDNVRRLKPPEYTARYLDALATIAMLKDEDDTALRYFHLALEKNPNYFRAYHNIIKLHQRRGRTAEAVKLMQKLQELNKSNVSRLVNLGESQMLLGDTERAEFYFQSALTRDQYCSGALNGMAEIYFLQGRLDESRQMLQRSHIAYKAAQRLNAQGIEMVKKARYADALEHYTKAQYVLPQQDKGPLLFYNIGLCYSRWGRLEMAQRFLKIALIKEPNYKKAQRLLQLVDERLGNPEGLIIEDDDGNSPEQDGAA